MLQSPGLLTLTVMNIIDRVQNDNIYTVYYLDIKHSYTYSLIMWQWYILNTMVNTVSWYKNKMKIKKIYIEIDMYTVNW